MARAAVLVLFVAGFAATGRLESAEPAPRSNFRFATYEKLAPLPTRAAQANPAITQISFRSATSEAAKQQSLALAPDAKLKPLAVVPNHLLYASAVTYPMAIPRVNPVVAKIPESPTRPSSSTGKPYFETQWRRWANVK